MERVGSVGVGVVEALVAHEGDGVVDGIMEISNIAFLLNSHRREGD